MIFYGVNLKLLRLNHADIKHITYRYCNIATLPLIILLRHWIKHVYIRCLHSFRQRSIQLTINCFYNLRGAFIAVLIRAWEDILLILWRIKENIQRVCLFINDKWCQPISHAFLSFLLIRLIFLENFKYLDQFFHQCIIQHHVIFLRKLILLLVDFKFYFQLAFHVFLFDYFELILNATLFQIDIEFLYFRIVLNGFRRDRSY